MHYTITDKSELATIAATPDSIKPFDVIIHKGIPFYAIYAQLQQLFAQVDLFPCGPGTDLYTRYGYDVSIVRSITPKP